jgi:hypothetical protein
LLSGIVELHRQFPHVDQLRLNVRTFLRLLEHETRHVLALPSLTRSSKNNRNEKGSLHFSD